MNPSSPDENAPAESTLVHIGLDSWIIQDGNYGDFNLGQQAKFALEFYPPMALRVASEGPAFAEHLVASRYHIRGKVIFLQEGVWVIDTGIFVAFREQKPPPDVVLGTWVEGEIYLGIDPFFYFEYLHTIEGMPLLTYTWIVRQIE